jgi:hypothetical protein
VSRRRCCRRRERGQAFRLSVSAGFGRALGARREGRFESFDPGHWGSSVEAHGDLQHRGDGASLLVSPGGVALPQGALGGEVTDLAIRGCCHVDVGGLAEIVPHERAGLVVPPENPEALSDAIVRFFKDNMADHLVAGVREEKKKYSWDRLYEAVEALMEAES